MSNKLLTALFLVSDISIVVLTMFITITIIDSIKKPEIEDEFDV
jgi:hypothetical protein